jgi:hypothetical protein
MSGRTARLRRPSCVAWSGHGGRNADAAVAVIAAERGEDILTSDPDDITRLAEHHKGIGRVVSLADLCEHNPMA